MHNNSLYEIFDNGGVRVAVIGVLSILALFLLAETMHRAANFGRSGVPATDTITVQGDGQATLPPDVARVSFTVDNTSTTVAQAQQATTKQANAALDFVKKQG
ncbi:MAG: SIMPL domain-containing protein, partial [Parcubacteria group bacterium]|nr:SIMPL domain-containing protein [Parcubacteria group bacterium]